MITVVCQRKATTHARLRHIDAGVRVEYGRTRWGVFRPDEVETLTYRDFPELKAVYDGTGWNLRELSALLETSDGSALSEAVTVLLTQRDINLLSHAGFSLA